MIIKKIRLTDFRNFETELFEFSPGTTVIVGPNASGKTNILEGINLLATGKSFRAKVQEEMVAYGEEVARVKGRINNIKESNKGRISSTSDSGKKGDHTDLEVVLTRGEITVGESPKKVKKVAKKRLLVNGVGKRLIDFAGNLKVVIFAPWHLDLVTESPSGRRDFLDDLLSLVDREYRRASLSYNKGLTRRNKILYRIREEEASRSQLLFWNKLLIKNGDYISKKREEFIEFANDKGGFDHHKFSLEYDKSAISEGRLEQYKNEEIAAATTLVGPHRDDFSFNVKGQMSNVKGRDLSRYGSRGEQRMGVLWLKLVELAYIKEESGDEPVLLLDDIFSELDHKHRAIVMEAAKGQQTIITTADPHYVEGNGKAERIEIGE